MATSKQVFNTTDGPLVVDEDGHALAGLKAAEVESTEEVRRLIGLGLLVEQQQPKKESASESASNTGKGSK